MYNVKDEVMEPFNNEVSGALLKRFLRLNQKHGSKRGPRGDYGVAGEIGGIR